MIPLNSLLLITLLLLTTALAQSTNNSDASGLSTGIIVAIVIVAVLVLLIKVTIVLCVIRYYRRRRNARYAGARGGFHNGVSQTRPGGQFNPTMHNGNAYGDTQYGQPYSVNQAYPGQPSAVAGGSRGLGKRWFERSDKQQYATPNEPPPLYHEDKPSTYPV